MKAFTLAAAIATLIALSPPARAADDLKITIIAEWIELELADLHRLTAGENRLPLGGTEQRKAVTALIEDNRAEVIHTAMLNARSGQRAKTEGIDEVIYPTDFAISAKKDEGPQVTHVMPTAFETRDVGPEMEADPILGFDGETVDLMCAVEFDTFLGNRTYGKDEAESEVPDFHNMKIVAALTLKSGRPRLAGTFKPHAPMGKKKRENPRLMLFLRVDVNPLVPVPENLAEQVARENQNRKGSLAFHYEFIETDLATLNKLLIENGISTRGPELREALVKAIDAGKATLIESAVAAGRAGERYTETKSGLELIYPTEWDPPVIGEDGSGVIPAVPVAFKTLQLGLTLSQQANFNGSGIKLNLSPHLNRFVALKKHLKDASEVSFPLTHQTNVTTEISLWPGETAFAGTLRPDKPAVADRKNPVIAVFVRGEVIDLDVEAEAE